METADAAAVLEQFRQFARRSGQAIYAWQDEVGLASLREAGELQVLTNQAHDRCLR